ncbi:conjugal transfer protein TraG N-terminal domain-containing protein [Pectobacterium versatile]|uniref:conjugal transfer protein TraG N-terminal domain-containing protein n=1 Tax=Pectobacterium versatile TaxID=2488639 RepID=UPI000C7F0731|nr:conjugal transfer protein TraG N-terminal domain-containing protein [Pectobacterium versatile]PLY36680.1 conjugal transfer protein TraG [Pectobacterium carotovorum]
MTANSFLEYFLVLFGWILNNAFWDILLSTGLFALPLVFKVLGIWLKVREEGADEGNKGILALPRMEHALYIAFCMMLFCCIPLLPVDINAIKFDSSRAKQCGINVPSPQNSGYRGLVNDFDGRTAEVPVWWYMLHLVSKGTTQAMIASIPCGDNLRQLRFEVQNTKLRDPVLLDEIQAFADQCYARSYFRLKSTNSQLSDATINSVGWIGSSYFLTTSGYYDTYTSTEPRSQWPYDGQRDSGYTDVGRGGYPTCKQWWSDGDNGLKSRVLANISDSTKKGLQRSAGSQWEEAALRWLVSPRNVGLSGTGESYTIGGNENYATGGLSGVSSFLSRMASTAGVGMKQIEAAPGFDALKQALPMIQALLEMMVIISIPILMMFSAYEPKIVVTISFVFFALVFITFWWELAGWLDDRLITILYDSMAEQGLTDKSPMAPLTDFLSSVSDGWIMNLVMGAMYIIFPMFWIGMFSWIGVNLGGAIAASLKDGANMPQQAGQDAGKMAKDTAMSQGKGVMNSVTKSR